VFLRKKPRDLFLLVSIEHFRSARVRKHGGIRKNRPRKHHRMVYTGGASAEPEDYGGAKKGGGSSMGGVSSRRGPRGGKKRLRESTLL